jgi:hypothetical protein
MNAVSKIGVQSTYSEERIPSESQLTTDAQLLEPLRHGERLVSNSDEGADSEHETVQHPALDGGLPNKTVQEKSSGMIPQGWPTSPQAIKLPMSTRIWNVFVDVALLSLSCAFLIFALFVLGFNGKPISSHQQAAERFEQASNWVSTLLIRLYRLLAHSYRALRSTLFHLHPSSDELPMQSYFGDSKGANMLVLWIYLPAVHRSRALSSRNFKRGS